MTARRLDDGGRIDRSRPIAFQFDGKTYSGYAGDSLASALLANDVAVVGRSFKRHRPRGLMSLGLEEPNAILNVGDAADVRPNRMATELALGPANLMLPDPCPREIDTPIGENQCAGWISEHAWPRRQAENLTQVVHHGQKRRRNTRFT